MYFYMDYIADIIHNRRIKYLPRYSSSDQGLTDTGRNKPIMTMKLSGYSRAKFFSFLTV